MQAIVKIIVALFFSHISVCEPAEEKKEEIAKIQITSISKADSCVPVDTSLDALLI